MIVTLKTRKKLSSDHLRTSSLIPVFLFAVHIFTLVALVFWVQNFTHSRGGLPFITPTIAHDDVSEMPEYKRVTSQTPTLIFNGRSILLAPLDKISRQMVDESIYPLIPTVPLDTEQFHRALQAIRDRTGSAAVIFIASDTLTFDRVSKIMTHLYGYTDHQGNYHKLFSKVVLGGMIL